MFSPGRETGGGAHGVAEAVTESIRRRVALGHTNIDLAQLINDQLPKGAVVKFEPDGTDDRWEHMELKR